MGPQDSSLLHRPYHNFPGQSSEVDYEAAEQLLQHSRRGRESNGDGMPGSTLDPESLIDLSGGSKRDRGLGDGPAEDRTEDPESHLQERHEESQYAPISNQPGLGQVCRYIQFCAPRVFLHRLRQEADMDLQ